MIVSRYGVHWAPGGIPFLLQHRRGAQNLISPDLDCPFTYRGANKAIACPHEIDLADHAPLPKWAQDPLAQAFLPVPGATKPAAILDPDRKLGPLLMQLSRLCSPAEPILHPFWFSSVYGFARYYRASNISPIVFLGAEAKHTSKVHERIELAELHERRILFVARERLPIFELEWITTELTDISAEPLEAIGAGALREHMLHEHPR